MEVETPSMVDPTMAPPGKHVMSIFVQYAAYNMPQYGNRDQQREAFGNAVIDTLADYCPNIKDIMLHKQVLTPADLDSDALPVMLASDVRSVPARSGEGF